LDELARDPRILNIAEYVMGPNLILLLSYLFRRKRARAWESGDECRHIFMIGSMRSAPKEDMPMVLVRGYNKSLGNDFSVGNFGDGW